MQVLDVRINVDHVNHNQGCLTHRRRLCTDGSNLPEPQEFSLTSRSLDFRPEREAALGQDSVPSGDVRELFSFQLQRLASLSTRIALLTIQPRFGVTTREWRVLAVLSYLGEVPLQELASHAGILKSQMSRTVTTLIGRGLIERSSNPSDGRSVLLRLSSEGNRLAAEILQSSRLRNRDMTAGLSHAECQVLMEYMQRVYDTSLHAYGSLRASATPAALESLDGDGD